MACSLAQTDRQTDRPGRHVERRAHDGGCDEHVDLREELRRAAVELLPLSVGGAFLRREESTLGGAKSSQVELNRIESS